MINKYNRVVMPLSEDTRTDDIEEFMDAVADHFGPDANPAIGAYGNNGVVYLFATDEVSSSE